MYRSLPETAPESLRLIEARMLSAGHDPKSLSLAAGLPGTYLRDLFRRGKGQPAPDRLAALAAYLGCSVTELGGEPPPEPPFIFTRHFTSGYWISDDRTLLNVDVIHAFLSTESYWARNRPRAVTEAAIAASFSFGVHAPDGTMAGFGRLITDAATHAHLTDVFILPAHRRQGLAQALIAAILEHPSLSTVRTWTLGTDDAHGLYARFGFGPHVSPQTQMIRVSPNAQW